MRLPLMIYRVAERSMEPAIMEGSYVIVNCWPMSMRIGEVVIAMDPYGRIIAKRIKKVNGSKLFLVGDNTRSSIDSRRFGWIGRERVLGKVIAVI